MATLTTVPAAQPPAAHRPWNTLDILSRSRTLLFALVALLVGTIVIATQTHRGAMQVVGNDTVPSIVKAQEIKSALADMDAAAANELLVPNDKTASDAFERNRIDASEKLVAAAHNITFGEAESKPIDAIAVGMGDYESQVQQALDQRDAGNKDGAQSHYSQAAALMDNTLLPQADALDAANKGVLERDYKARSDSSFTARVFVALLGIAAVVALVLAQLFLSRRMRRTLNPALLAATLLAGGLTVYAFTALYTEQAELATAKISAFDSIHALLQARAAAYSANADESRYLLDPLHGDALRKFDRNSQKLATLPNETPDEFAAQLRTGKPILGFTGFLADEYNNVTLPHEQESADRSILALRHYLDVDKELRALEHDGHHPEAIKLCLGLQPDESDGAFNLFDAALGMTLKINQDEFDRAVASGFSAVANLEWIACGAGLLLAVLIFFGFAPRIREYQ